MSRATFFFVAKICQNMKKKKKGWQKRFIKIWIFFKKLPNFNFGEA
jgi:hypothetical protein